MVLNELSLKPSASTIQQARQRMIDFLDTARIATKSGVKKVIRTSDDLSYLSLAPDYPLARWRNDHEVDVDTRRFFRSLVTKSPYLKDTEDSDLENRNARSQFTYQDEEAKGLGVAYLLEALAISFRSASCWEQSSLKLTLIELDEEGELQEEQELHVNHACSAAHIDEHKNWIREHILTRIQLNISEGCDIWTHRTTLFPHLLFCEAVEKQLQGVLQGHPLLQQIIKRLYALNTACENWCDGPDSYEGIPGRMSPESNVTLQKYTHEHTFLCPDGVNRLFSWHARLTPSAWRIYFYRDDEKKTLTIGHIGHKLPNVLYPT